MNKVCKRALTASLLALALILSVFAASEPWILEAIRSGNQLTMYVRHSGGAKIAEISVGGEKAEKAEIADDTSETPMVTWLLLDNSNDMPAEVREKVSDVLMTLIGTKGPNETFNLCTFSDRLSVKLRSSGNFADLKRQLEMVEYYEQETYLMGALDTVLTEEATRAGLEFVRIVVISAGGNNIPTGESLENLRQRLSTSGAGISNVPIYTIGCPNGENADVLNQMYSLSTQTHARSWSIDDVGAQDIANIMRWEEVPFRAKLEIPAKFLSGEPSTQTIFVSFADGTSAQVSQNFPGGGNGSVPPPPPDPDIPVWLVVALIVLVVGAIVGGVVYFLIHRKKEDTFQSPRVKQPDFGPSSNRYNDEGKGSTSIVGQDDWGDEEGDSSTELLVKDDSPRMLQLVDINHPERQYNASLQGPVTVGRNKSNRIQVDETEKSVSGRHCEIYEERGMFYIRDLGSANGTYVDEIRVADAVDIASGSTIRLGRLNLRVTIR